ncbi:hypothetical protein AB0K35_27795 [Micromonospora sp. NPDC053740]|uniref:hypothetical protein n=1 Tax=Micromonospora sp. NPDC053740 TaxID=3155173 RepID=UPI0034244634
MISKALTEDDVEFYRDIDCTAVTVEVAGGRHWVVDGPSGMVSIVAVARPECELPNDTRYDGNDGWVFPSGRPIIHRPGHDPCPLTDGGCAHEVGAEIVEPFERDWGGNDTFNGMLWDDLVKQYEAFAAVAS